MTASVLPAEVRSVWRQFLIDREFARNYTLGYLDHPGPAPKNPVVERLLPSLLHVKAVAILDHAFRAWIEERGLTVPRKPYGTDLKGRIDFLADNSIVCDREPLHSIRDTRNDIAHEPAEEIAWGRLDQDVLVIAAALQELRLVDETPKWEVFSERSSARAAEIPNALASFHYRIAIKAAEGVIAEIKWQTHVMRDNA
jgi:hypothetical protein